MHPRAAFWHSQAHLGRGRGRFSPAGLQLLASGRQRIHRRRQLRLRRLPRGVGNLAVLAQASLAVVQPAILILQPPQLLRQLFPLCCRPGRRSPRRALGPLRWRDVGRTFEGATASGARAWEPRGARRMSRQSCASSATRRRRQGPRRKRRRWRTERDAECACLALGGHSGELLLLRVRHGQQRLAKRSRSTTFYISVIEGGGNQKNGGGGGGGVRGGLQQESA